MQEAGLEETFDNVFDKFTSKQEFALDNLISEMK